MPFPPLSSPPQVKVAQMESPRSQPFTTVFLSLLLVLGVSCKMKTQQAAATADPDGRITIEIPDPAGNAQLVLHPVCQSRACPLVIVSHGRKGQALDGINHPVFDAVLDELDRRGYALLLSDDAGGETWGNDQALESIKRTFEKATQNTKSYRWDGRVYTLGISMGGLPATLTAFRQTLGVKVKATALIAGRVNLQDAMNTSAVRKSSIQKAHQAPGETLQQAVLGHDPVGDFLSFKANTTPLLAVVSRDDTAVNSNLNGALLVHKSRGLNVKSRLIWVKGPHLAGGLMNQKVARQVAAFFSSHP